MSNYEIKCKVIEEELNLRYFKGSVRQTGFSQVRRIVSGL